MALIVCPECGNSVSSNALACPRCGNPIKKDNTIRVKFPNKGTLLPGCYVYDANDNVLAQCKQGEVASFTIDKEEIFISCKMNGYFGRAEITAKPGERFVVNTRFWGNIGISKVDTIDSSDNDGSGGFFAGISYDL